MAGETWFACREVSALVSVEVAVDSCSGLPVQAGSRKKGEYASRD